MPSVIGTLQALVGELRATNAEQQPTIKHFPKRILMLGLIAEYGRGLRNK